MRVATAKNIARNHQQLIFFDASSNKLHARSPRQSRKEIKSPTGHGQVVEITEAIDKHVALAAVGFDVRLDIDIQGRSSCPLSRLGAQTKLYCCNLIISRMTAEGPWAKPSRQPGMA